MELPSFHQRVLKAATGLCQRYGLVLAGGYAMRAHGLVERESQDIDLATAHPLPLPQVAEGVAAGYREAGFDVTLERATPRMAHLFISDPATGEWVRLDLLREALQQRAVMMDPVPVVGLEDAVGLKVRALHGRTIARDFIDVASVGHLFSFRELERLCRIHEEDFSISELASHLGGVDLIDDSEFEAYGLDAGAIARVRRFAFGWLEDIKQRRVEDGDIEVWLDPDTYPD
jgi:hypothetical protein